MNVPVGVRYRSLVVFWCSLFVICVARPGRPEGERRGGEDCACGTEELHRASCLFGLPISAHRGPCALSCWTGTADPFSAGHSSRQPENDNELPLLTARWAYRTARTAKTAAESQKPLYDTVPCSTHVPQQYHTTPSRPGSGPLKPPSQALCRAGPLPICSLFLFLGSPLQR